jgi:hypothetical protein
MKRMTYAILPMPFMNDFSKQNTERPASQGQISICETLDRVLNKGAVVSGEIVISVADIDLLYLNVQLLLTSIETINELRQTLAPREQATELEPSR